MEEHSAFTSCQLKHRLGISTYMETDHSRFSYVIKLSSSNSEHSCQQRRKTNRTQSKRSSLGRRCVLIFFLLVEGARSWWRCPHRVSWNTLSRFCPSYLLCLPTLTIPQPLHASSTLLPCPVATTQGGYLKGSEPMLPATWMFCMCICGISIPAHTLCESAAVGVL